MRAFIAVNLEKHMLTEIENIQLDLTSMVKGFRWVSRELLHITLKFLSEIDAATIPNISRAVEIASYNHVSFTLSFSGIGAFPSLKRPRIIWIGLEKGASELTALAADINRALKEIHRETKENIFKPHLTIGRAKKNENAWISQTALSRKWCCTGTLSVDSIFLMESNLTPSGPIYRPVRKFLLK